MSKFKNMLDFSGKNIVITGGLGLIGYHVSRAFAEFNGNVIIADIDEKKFRRLKSDKSLDSDKYSFVHFDISDPARVKKNIKKILKNHTVVDVWVNLAYPKAADWKSLIKDVNFESWNENIRMHLGGYFWTSKLILEHMKSQGHGCLINFGSIYGAVGPNFDIYKDTAMMTPAAYSVIKGAIISLSRYFATLYGPYNVRVNSICPGGVFDRQDSRFVRRYNKLTPLKRMAKAEEIAIPTILLASEGASYITGHTLMVDGGWSAW